MSNKTHGRRRANTRAKTPLTELTEALSANTGVVGRRAAVVAAAGGLAVAAGLPTAVGASGGADHSASVKTAEKVDYSAQPAAKVAGAVKDASSSAVAGGAVKATKAPSVGSATQSGTGDKSAGKSSGDSGSKVSVPSSGTRGAKAVAIAKQYVGTPYVWGGSSPSGWDCSGFVAYVYNKLGVSLPHSSSGIKSAGTVISRSEAQPGDIMYHPGHVGIYAGNGKMIDARGKKWGTVYTSASWMSDAVYVRLK